MQELRILEMTGLQVASYIMATLIEDLVTYDEVIIFFFVFSPSHTPPLLRIFYLYLLS